LVNLSITIALWSTAIWVSLLYLVHISKLRPKLEVCSKFMKTYYTE